MNNRGVIDVGAGVIVKDKKVLICKRPKSKHQGGRWEFPGGKKKEDEDILECIKRELHEELGIVVRPTKKIVSVNFKYPEKEVNLHIYLCHIISGIPAGLEGQRVEWIEIDNLDKVDLTPPDKMALYNILKEVRGEFF